MYDEDHAGISDDLSCVSEVSAIDEAQFPDETYECVDGDIPGWSPQGLDDMNPGDDYSYCITHQYSTVRRNYIEILQLLPNSQYNGALTPRPKERIHHVHRRNMTTGHLRHDGITATMRKSESSV